MSAEFRRTVTNQEETVNIKALLLGMSCAGIACTLPAHDLWLTSAPSGTQLAATIFFGETNRRDLPVVQRLANVDVIEDKGTVSLRGGTFTEQKANNSLLTSPFDQPGAGAVLAASYDNGYWLNTPEGARNVSRRLIPQGSNTRWVAKFAKTLMGPGAYTRVLGQELELVALEDPFTLAGGKSLQVRVQLRQASHRCESADTRRRYRNGPKGCEVCANRRFRRCDGAPGSARAVRAGCRVRHGRCVPGVGGSRRVQLYACIHAELVRSPEARRAWVPNTPMWIH